MERCRDTRHCTFADQVPSCNASCSPIQYEFVISTVSVDYSFSMSYACIWSCTIIVSFGSGSLFRPGAAVGRARHPQHPEQLVAQCRHRRGREQQRQRRRRPAVFLLLQVAVKVDRRRLPTPRLHAVGSPSDANVGSGHVAGSRTKSALVNGQSDGGLVAFQVAIPPIHIAAAAAGVVANIHSNVVFTRLSFTSASACV